MSKISVEFKASDLMREAVDKNSSVILVMGRFGISLGFGDKTIGEVCKSNQVDTDTFLEVINCTARGEYNYEAISLESLMGYLKNAHEYYLEFNLPTIRRKLIEAIDCSSGNEIALLIVKFYDEYVKRVKRHMEYENKVIFVYVEQLLKGVLNSKYSITSFEGKHTPISSKLQELKDVIIRYYPENNNYLLNEVLLNIIACEEDLKLHCAIEDNLFIPAVKKMEQNLSISQTASTTEEEETSAPEGASVLSDREKDVLICVAKGMSNKEIADSLFLSIHTVTTHRRNISAKLNIHTSVGLAIYAISNKLVTIDEIK